MPYATNFLVAEHDLILRMLKVIHAVNQRLQNKESVPADDLYAIIDFIRNFADRCHHAKEEDLLYVKMQERGFSMEQGPVAVMLYEHDMGRNFLKAMEEGVRAYEKGEKEAIPKIIQNSNNYAQLLSEHIHKENNILYPMADRVFSDEDQQVLKAEFERVEQEVIGKEVQEKYRNVVLEMEKKYLQ